MSKLEFKPNLTPRQVIERGAFGGSYFGIQIKGKTEYNYNELFQYHFKGLDKGLYLGDTYKPSKNRYKVRSGMPYEYWLEKKWIEERDPYGWFEWWCKYEMGLRGDDDNRQINRWIDFTGRKGRWRNNIYKKIHKTDNWQISPRIQQSLLHWGYEVNEQDYIVWCKDNGKVYKEEEWCNYGGLPSPMAYM